MMREAGQELSALFGSASNRPVSTFASSVVFVLCAALAYPLATEAGYAAAVGGAFVFCIATLILAYSFGVGASAFTSEAAHLCLPGLKRLKHRANFITGVVLLALVVVPVAALIVNPLWEAWVPTALVLGIAFANVLIPLLYPSVNLRLSDDTDSGDTLRHTLTQEYADDAEPTFAFQAPRGRPSLVGRAPGGPA